MIITPYMSHLGNPIIIYPYRSCQEKEVTFLQILSERLQDLRKMQNWSQEAAAKNFGIPFRTYRRYEIGERDAPFSIMIKIADLYGVSLDYLAGRTDDPRFESKKD